MELIEKKEAPAGLLRRVKGIWILVAAALVLALNFQEGQAGVFGPNKKTPPLAADLVLYGATEYRSVWIFFGLLETIEEITAVEPVVMQLRPDSPDDCRAQWRVETEFTDIFDLVERIMSKIKKLDPKAATALGYREAAPLVEADLAQLKRAVPVSVTAQRAVFSLGAAAGQEVESEPDWAGTSGNRWQLLPGAGFE